jgi:predicted acetyltransferase
MERWRHLLDLERALCAVEGETLVATAADLPFRLTVPGGEISAAGVSLVGVLPTHRRRGILRQMMHRQLLDARQRGDPVAILYASEGLIYPRFGYGVVSFDGRIDLERDRAIFRDPAGPVGETRLVPLTEAARLLPPIYDRVRTMTAGMISRSDAWWVHHRLQDTPESREGAGPKQCVIWQHAGEAAYAIYRVRPTWTDFTPASSLEVLEVIATSPVAHREIWRFLFGIDLIKTVKADLLPIDHPLLLMIAEPRRLHFTLTDALWLRLVDLPAALAARTYGADDALVFDVVDTFCDWDAGAWRLESRNSHGEVTRANGQPDIRLPSERLASAYLGGISFARLARAGWVQELTPGAIARADRLFRIDHAPWCAEIF